MQSSRRFAALRHSLVVVAASLALSACESALEPAPRPGASVVDGFLPTQLWQPGPSIPTPLTAMAGVMYQGCAWSIGGRHGLWSDFVPPSNDVWISCASKSGPAAWTRGPWLPRALADFGGAAVMSGRIYVVGGLDSGRVHSPRLWVYTPTTGWKADPELMPRAVACGAAAVARGKLYVFGIFQRANGFGNCDDLNRPTTFLVYDPAQPAGSRWSELPRPSRVTYHRWPGLAAFNDKLYLIGGNDYEDFSSATGRVDVFDVVAGAWLPDTQLPPPMPVPRRGFGVVLAQNRIYTIGGFNGHISYIPCGLVEAYDPATNGWAQLRPMGCRDFPAAYAVGNTIAVLGTDWFTGAPASVQYEQLGVGASACDVFEPDGVPATATPWAVWDPGFTTGLTPLPVTEGRLCSALDEDYFSFKDFSVDAALVTFRLVPPPGTDYELTLLDGSGKTVLARSSNPGPVSEAISVQSAGNGKKYLLRVTSQDGSSENVLRYRLDVH
jgi:hypothetical protein